MEKSNDKAATNETRDVLLTIYTEAPQGEKHMRKFVEAAKQGNPIEAETMGFFISAFEAVLNGENPKKALKLTTGRGNKLTAKSISKYLEDALKIERLRGEGKGADDARNEVCKETGQDYKTVRRHHKAFEAAAIDLLKVMGIKTK